MPRRLHSTSCSWEEVPRGSRARSSWPVWPWENGYNESFNAKLRDEFMSGEIFYTLSEAVVLVEQ